MGPQKNFSWTQFFPPKPKYTQHDVPSDLRGKVYVVTGANSGMGKELARVLYAKHAKVYVACRTEEKGAETIDDIKKAVPASKGELVSLKLNLSDLRDVREAASIFLSRESKFHILFNNAGVMVGAGANKTAQGYEEAMGVNCVGTYLFTKLLTPALIAGAKSEPVGTVRVVWLSSFGLEQFAPEGGSLDMDAYPPDVPIERYGLSKVGAWLLAVEYARRHGSDGVVSVAINPGNIKTALARHQGIALKLIAGAIVYPVTNGVSTQLFAGFSPEVSTKLDWRNEWGKCYSCNAWPKLLTRYHPPVPAKARLSLPSTNLVC